MESKVDFHYDAKGRRLFVFCDEAGFSHLRNLLATDPIMAPAATGEDVQSIEIVNADAIKPETGSQFYILWVIAVVIAGMLLIGFICSGVMVWIDQLDRR